MAPWLRETALQHALAADFQAAGFDGVSACELEERLTAVRDTLYRWRGNRLPKKTARPIRWLAEIEAAITALPVFEGASR